MASIAEIQLFTLVALIAVALGVYFGATQIDSLARHKYLKKKTDGVGRRDLSSRSEVIKEERNKVRTVVIDAELNTVYKQVVNSTLEYIFQFSYLQDVRNSQAVAVQVTSTTAFKENPVLVVIRQQKAVQSWQLPLLMETASGLQEFNSASRTLCEEPLKDNITVEHDFYLGISTSEHRNLTFVASVSVVQDYLISLDRNYTTTVTATEPKYFQFLFPENVTNVLLKLHSDDTFCMTVSVQNLSCPVFDTESDLKYEGVWQTLMNQSGMTISRERFPDGFFLVFVVKADDYECTGKRAHSTSFSRFKTVHFSLHEKIGYVKFMFAVLGVMGIFVFFYIVAFIAFCFNCIDNIPEELSPSLMEVQHHRPVTYGSTTSSTAVPPENSDGVEDPPLETDHKLTGSTESSVDLTDVDLLTDAFVDNEVVRSKTFLFVSDLARKGPYFHENKSQLYMWNLIIVAIFYALPVVQLVVIYQKVLNDTGDQDLCYFNFLCAHPLGQLTDFNHVYSNIGYVLLGLLFIINTARRDIIRRKAQARHDRLEKFYGIPQHFGLFYAMGMALMVEGILSASYHICPTHANYQFDTTFMYVLSILCVLKIYQTRHPDINAEAHACYAFLAFIVLLGVVSVFEDGLVFRILFTILHLAFCLALCTQIYYMGRWRLDVGIFKRIYLVWWNDFQAGPSYWFRPMYTDRMILLILGFLVNVGLEIYAYLQMPVDFATFILAIFITNLMLYTIFYIIMKLRYGERILCQPLMYIILAMMCWAPALYFFINKAATWKKRAAESRAINQECVILNIYDYHDIWHFLSATSLFFSFMILLTLDDDLRFTPRDRIPVF